MTSSVNENEKNEKFRQFEIKTRKKLKNDDCFFYYSFDFDIILRNIFQQF